MKLRLFFLIIAILLAAGLLLPVNVYADEQTADSSIVLYRGCDENRSFDLAQNSGFHSELSIVDTSVGRIGGEQSFLL